MSKFRIRGSHFQNALLYRISLLFLLILGALSLVLSKERLYGDSADYLYRIIQDSSFFIIHSRPASVFIEWLPVLLIKMQVDLNIVVLAFSFSEWLWMFFSFILLGIILKSPKHAIAIVLVYLFSLRWNYFNPVSELILAFPLFIILHYLWTNFQKRTLIVNLLLSWTIGLFLFFSHPLYIAALPVMLVYIWFQEAKNREYIFIGIGLLVLLIIRYLYLDTYEMNSISSQDVSLNANQMLKRFVSIGAIYELTKCYAGLIFLFFAGLVSLYKTNGKMRMLVLGGFVIGFAGLVAHKFGGLYPETFEPFERYIFIIPLTVVTVLIPVWSKWLGWKRNVLILLMFWQAFYIVRYSDIVVNRYEVFENALYNARQFEESKVIIRKENYHPEFLSNRINGHDWIMPSESLILTAMKGKNETKQVFIKEIFQDDFYDNLQQDEFLYYISSWMEKVGNMNPVYMHMNPSAWLIPNTDSVQSITHSIAKQIDFSLLEKGSFQINEKTHLQIQLDNKSGKIIYSGMRIRKLGIGYKWLAIGSDSWEKGLFISPLMTDLVKTVRQRIIIVGPEKPGDYLLIPGLQYQDNGDFYPFGEYQFVHVN